MTPIFILSLPRCGSTLLQRMLSMHDDICTAAEPWLLLPLVYSTKREGVYSVYGHRSLVSAVEDFYSELPGGKKTYWDEIRCFSNNLYKLRCNKKNAEYFLDKTPRYHLIVNELFEIFPDAKFIFLWRNPLAVVSSIMKTWGKGKWNIYRYNIDIYSGMESLMKAYEDNKDKCLSVNYENILQNPAVELARIQEYIGAQKNNGLDKMFLQAKLDGRMGDPNRFGQSRGIDTESLDKWSSEMTNPIRKKWAISYLNWITPERLEMIGYNSEDIISKLSKVNTNFKYLFSDSMRFMFGCIYSIVEPHVLKHKFLSLKNGKRLYSLR